MTMHWNVLKKHSVTFEAAIIHRKGRGTFNAGAYFIEVCITGRAGIVQSVYRLATDWTTEGSEFGCRCGQEFSLLYVVQTDSGASPASYPMGAGGSFPGGKAAEA
jgi:hypothetical protein